MKKVNIKNNLSLYLSIFLTSVFVSCSSSLDNFNVKCSDNNDGVPEKKANICDNENKVTSQDDGTSTFAETNDKKDNEEFCDTIVESNTNSQDIICHIEEENVNEEYSTMASCDLYNEKVDGINSVNERFCTIDDIRSRIAQLSNLQGEETVMLKFSEVKVFRSLCENTDENEKDSNIAYWKSVLPCISMNFDEQLLVPGDLPLQVIRLKIGSNEFKLKLKVINFSVACSVCKLV